MALALIKIKIMPDSPQADLDNIETKTRELLEKQGSKSIKFEREPIAFGLIAVIAMISWEEEISIDPTIDAIQEFKNVSSAEVIDFRRAIG
ncbi:MAG: elongation factor 1-beta [Candidatus Pacearchaeota archaeon]|jgi:translation elongation factor aEF-1 beta